MSADRDASGRDSLTLQAIFVLIIGASAALVSLQVGASPEFILLAGLSGLLLGVVVTWFVVRNLRRVMPDTPDLSDREW